MSKIFFFMFLISFLISYGSGRYVHQRSKEGSPMSANNRNMFALGRVLWGILAVVSLLIFGSTLND